MDHNQEPQRIPDEREFLHELSNPITTALALATKVQRLKDPDELRATAERLTKALEQIVNLVKTRRQQMKDLEN